MQAGVQGAAHLGARMHSGLLQPQQRPNQTKPHPSTGYWTFLHRAEGAQESASTPKRAQCVCAGVLTRLSLVTWESRGLTRAGRWLPPTPDRHWVLWAMQRSTGAACWEPAALVGCIKVRRPGSCGCAGRGPELGGQLRRQSCMPTTHTYTPHCAACPCVSGSGVRAAAAPNGGGLCSSKSCDVLLTLAPQVAGLALRPPLSASNMTVRAARLWRTRCSSC